MLPRQSLSTAQIASKIRTYLDLSLLSSATFLAGRFHAQVKTQESLNLLATCYRREYGPEDAYILLSASDGSLSIQNIYLHALCAYESKKLEHSEKILTQLTNYREWQPGNLPQSKEYLAAAYTLLGNIQKKKSNTKGAQASYIASLRMDALLWTPFRELCDIGCNVEHCLRPNQVSYGNNGVGTNDILDGVAGNKSSTEVEKPQTKNGIGSVGAVEKDDASGIILKHLHCIANGYNQMSLFQCREAVRSFESLPKEQLNTPYVLTLIAKAYFELTEYGQAKFCFEKLTNMELLKTHGMALYSTTLWLLKDEVALSYLARGVIDSGIASPETWCVIGNCFSLQKEHETAISFFQRAIQLDVRYAYAYTLSGHEFVSNEDFDKALDCYRHAIRIEPRQYNAWYGLGIIYFRQEKYNLSYHHFKRALSINPNSSVLLCYIGMVISQMGEKNIPQAMVAFEKASSLEPRNPQARYQRALLLLKLNRLDEALQELYLVRDFAPAEASVCFEIGKICMQLCRYDEARINFNAAHDLDPKNANMYKSYMDKLNERITLP
jgi:anaphase-promoting complex subunit 3